MEPGRLRENPPGSGAPEAAGWRENSPAAEVQEAAGGALKERHGDRNTGQPETRANETGSMDKDGAEDDEEDEQYEEEELDPRIQVSMIGLCI